MINDDLTFTINYFQDEDGIFTTVVPEIKGCIASGKTLSEAYENTKIAIESCIEARNILNMSLNRDNPYKDIHQYKIPRENLA